MFDFTFDSKNKKVLIALPFPSEAHYEENKVVREITTGDMIGEYFLYNATGFINALERDCLCVSSSTMRRL